MAGRTHTHTQPPPHVHIEPRVSRLESVVEGLDEDIKGLSASFDRMAKSTSHALQRQYDVIDRQSNQVNTAISALQTTLAGSGKANWPVMLSACGLVLAISATVGGLAMQPWKDRHVSLEERVDQIDGQATIAATTIAAQHEKNIEIETQFKAAKELEEMRYEMGMSELRHVRELMELSRRPHTTGHMPSSPAPSALLPAAQAAP